jgi:hypothetical protein
MKVHNGTTTEEDGNLAYMDLVAGLGRHHRHTRLVPEGQRLRHPEPETLRSGQLPRSCGDSQPPDSGE